MKSNHINQLILCFATIVICCCRATLVAQTLPINYSFTDKLVPRNTCVVKSGSKVYTALQVFDTSMFTNFTGILMFDELDSSQRFWAITDTSINLSPYIYPKLLEIYDNKGVLTAIKMNNLRTDSTNYKLLKIEFEIPTAHVSIKSFDLPILYSDIIDMLRLSVLKTDSFTYYYGNYTSFAESPKQGAFILQINKKDSLVNQIAESGENDQSYGYKLGTLLYIEDTLVCFNSICNYEELNKRSVSTLQVVAAYPITRGFSPQLNDNYLQASNNFEHGTVRGKSSIYQFVTVDTVYETNPPLVDYMWRSAIRKYDYKQNKMLAGKPLHMDIQSDESSTCYFMWANSRYIMLDEEHNAVYVCSSLLENREQLYVARFDTNLNLIWQRFISADLDDYNMRYLLRDATLDTNEFIYLTGNVVKGKFTNPFVLKLGVNNGFYSGVDNPIVNEIPFYCYPNPVQNKLSFTNTVDECWLYNSIGQLLTHSTKVSSIDMSSFPTGIYFLHLDLNGAMHQQKIIKN